MLSVFTTWAAWGPGQRAAAPGHRLRAGPRSPGGFAKFHPMLFINPLISQGSRPHSPCFTFMRERLMATGHGAVGEWVPLVQSACQVWGWHPQGLTGDTSAAPSH